MKSWLHEISESYIGSRVASRKDLKEHYVSLTEEQRFGLLSENVLAYLDEQLRNAYGIGIEDLNEEQLNEIVSNLAMYAGRGAVLAGRGAVLAGRATGRAVGGIVRGAKATAGAIKQGAKAVGVIKKGAQAVEAVKRGAQAIKRGAQNEGEEGEEGEQN